MDYRVEELAARAQIPVDTIRFYQSRGLLPPPRRSGRVAIYDDAHLDRLGRIRGLLREGLTLQLIGRVLEREQAPPSEPAPLALALVAELVGERTLSAGQLAAEAGIPEALVSAARAAGLVEPIRAGGEERYTEADLRMARAGLALLSAGIPLNELLDLAVRHARATQQIAEQAIDLFDLHVRRRTEAPPDAESVTTMYRQLLPEATRLVALHFQRMIVNRALARLEGSGEAIALREAIAATESSRLEVSWR